MAEFDPITGRVTLTKAHIASEQGQKLILLILEIGLDGELSDTELVTLSEWLKSAPSEIPAIRHLRELVSDALNDGVISDEERKILHKQIERILPITERERVAAARKVFQERRKTEQASREQCEKEERGKLRDEERAQREAERNHQWQENNRPTEPQLRYIKALGGSLPHDATRLDASELIDRLVHSNGSISARQQMVLRFWSITPETHWGRAQVSVWMDSWYEQDSDRQLAWELFKEEHGDTGTSCDPSRVPVGAGYAYLRKLKDRKNGSPIRATAPSKGGLSWFSATALAAFAIIGSVVLWKALRPETSGAPQVQTDAPVSAISTAQATPQAATQSEIVKPESTSRIARPSTASLSHDSALQNLAQSGFEESPLQIPATVIDVGILKNVPYLSYRVGNDRELNIYGDPESPACVEFGLYRGLLSSSDEKLRCGAYLQKLFPELSFNTVKITGGKSIKGDWVIEVTLPDSPDAYGGWWVSVYNLTRLHQAAGTRANVTVVSEPANASTDWTPQQLGYARPSSSYSNASSQSSSSHSSPSASSNYSSGRVYVKSYYRKDGTYVRSHTRRK